MNSTMGLAMRNKVWLVLFLLLGAGCAAVPGSPSDEASPYVLIFAGDRDERESDFLAVFDVRPGSPTVGQVISTVAIGMKGSVPHHMEYELPDSGEVVFVNAHHHEATLLVNANDPQRLKIEKVLRPPLPLRFGHDFARLANGNLILGFLRSEGPSPNPRDALVPGGHGGIAEYTGRGELIRVASAAPPGSTEPVRTYAILPMLDIDRVVTTSAPMMEHFVADVIQVWRYSDFTLLHTMQVPPGKDGRGVELQEAARYPFGPRLLDDGSVMINSYGCAFSRLTAIDTDQPQLTNVYTIQVPDPADADETRGACSIPVRIGKFWIMPVGRAHVVVVLDVSDPANPVEVSRLQTPEDFSPHWLARDPESSRLVLGAELGGEQGM
jgi:hypothetical protein